ARRAPPCAVPPGCGHRTPRTRRAPGRSRGDCAPARWRPSRSRRSGPARRRRRPSRWPWSAPARHGGSSFGYRGGRPRVQVRGQACGGRAGAAFTAPCEHGSMRNRLSGPLAALLFTFALGIGVASARDAAPVPPAAGTASDTIVGAGAALDAAEGPSAELLESRRLARRLQDTGLADVSVTVRDGVAELQGVVLAPEDRERAEQVAAQQPGIDRVDNRVVLSANFTDRVATASELALDKVT